MNISFEKGAWDLQALTYAYSRRWEDFPEFTQEADCVCNRFSPQPEYNHENIPLLAKKKYGSGTRITTRCSFEDYGAPLIMLTGDLETDENGRCRFSDYLEVVLWTNGINVWLLRKEAERWDFKLLMGVEFPVSTCEIHTLSVKVMDKTLKIQADDRKMSLYVPDLYPTFYTGITACEGINRFYDLQIEGPEL